MIKYSFNLRQKITFFFLVGMAVIILIVGSVSAVTLSNLIEESKLDQLESIVNIQKSRLDSLSIAGIEKVKGVSSRTKLRALLQSYNNNSINADVEAMKSILVDARDSIDDYKSITLVDKNGAFVVSTDDNQIENTEELQRYFEMAKKKEHIHYKKTIDNSVLILHGPLLLNEELLGVVIIEASTEPIIQVTKDYTGLGNTGETVIAQYSNDDNTKATFLHNRRFENSTATQEFSMSDKIPMVDALQGLSTLSNKFVDYRGQEVYSSTEKSEITGWGIVVKQDYDEVTAPVSQYMWILTSMVVASSLAILIIAYYFSARMKKSFDQLGSGIRILESGDLDYRIKIDSMDEVGLIAQSFNNMAYNLKNARKEVNKKVLKQTQDIERQKQSMEDQQAAIMNILEDVEEEKQGAEQSANDLKKFELAVAGASDHIVITDPEGVVLYANEAVGTITGFKQEDIIGKKVGDKDLWGGLMDKDFYKRMWKVIKNDKKVFKGEFNNKRKNGEQFIAAANIIPITGKNDNVLFFVGIERDITKEREVDQAKTEFVSLASHQLRTPLSAINWYAEMLLNKDAGEINSEQEGYLREIYKGNQRMVDLVNSLLNVSRLELGTFEINPEMTSLKEIGKEVLKELAPSIKIKRQEIKEKYSKNLPKAKVDKKLIRIILQNLLSNAVKYTPNRGVISLEILYSNKGHTIKVSDTGYGIPKDQHDRVFSKLFRADNVRAMDTEGTGLGLYIIKSILDHSGGKITFTSAKNKGTTFTALIPKSGMKQKEGSKSLD